MNARLFKSVFLVAIAVFFVSLVAITAAFYFSFQNEAVSLGHAENFSLSAMLLGSFYPLLAIIVLMLVLSAVIAAVVARKIVMPIKSLNIETPDDRDVYEELRPLAQRVNEQNRTIYEQMDALGKEHGKQDAMRREFTANVSHELKTPLTSISGYAEIIRDGVASKEDIAPFAGKIYDEAQRMIVLVGDILRLSELETKELPTVWEEADIYAVCGEVAQRLSAVAKTAEVSLELTGQSAELTCVRHIIDDIAFNLCDNAIKYTEPGGVIKMSVSQDEESVTLSVSDNGIGIPRKDLDRVFERFYRVDKSHSREKGGTGLGLSIVKHGASLHQASLDMKSELGKGTSISVIFPKNRTVQS